MPSPMSAAQPYFQQAQDLYSNTFNPYIGPGQNAFGANADIYGRMASSPTDYFNEIMSQYSPTRGFDEFRNDETMKALRQAAYAGGYAGNDYDQEMQARLFNDLLEADRDKWYERVIGLQNTGLEGQQNIAGMGLNAGQNLAEGLGGTYMDQARMAYENQQARNKKKQGLMSSVLGGLGGAATGFMVGGPAGAALGALGGFTGSLGGGGSVDNAMWNRIISNNQGAMR